MSGKYVNPSDGWQTIAECVPAWEQEEGVRVVVQIRFDKRIALGAYVEALLVEDTGPGSYVPLCVVRNTFPATKGKGHAAVVMRTIFEVFAAYERDPWMWTKAKRERAVPRGGEA